MVKKIDTETLLNAYDENNSYDSWHVCNNTEIGDVALNIPAASGGDASHGWKIHISIDPSKILEATAIISEIINQSDVSMGIKFASTKLAKEG